MLVIASADNMSAVKSHVVTYLEGERSAPFIGRVKDCIVAG